MAPKGTKRKLDNVRNVNAAQAGASSVLPRFIPSQHVHPPLTQGAAFGNGNAIPAMPPMMVPTFQSGGVFPAAAAGPPRAAVLTADFSGTHESGRTASVATWCLFHPRADEKMDVFASWKVDLERAYVANRFGDENFLPDIDPVDLIAFMDRYPSSDLPSMMEQGMAQVTNNMTGIRIGNQVYKLERRLTAPPLRIPTMIDKGLMFAWFCEKLDGSGCDKLTGSTFNGVTFGLCVSFLLEQVYEADPNAIVHLHAYGLNGHTVDFNCMVMSRPNGETLPLQRVKVEITPRPRPNWVPMEVSENLMAILVPMDRDDRDYRRELAGLIPEGKPFIPQGRRNLITFKVVQVYKIQNQRRLDHFRAKGADYRSKYAPYRDEVKLEKKLVFHGTSPDALSAICLENFDWRRAGEATGTRFGSGVYFGATFVLSDMYARDSYPSPSTAALVAPGTTRKFMFVAAAHVGLCVVGNPSMRYPPVWKNGVTYDTAVDDVRNPSMYIKFDGDDFFAKYLIEYEVLEYRQAALAAAPQQPVVADSQEPVDPNIICLD